MQRMALGEYSRHSLDVRYEERYQRLNSYMLVQIAKYEKVWSPTPYRLKVWSLEATSMVLEKKFVKLLTSNLIYWAST